LTLTVHEVAVVGSGPAGATAARLLAEWGHSVVLLARLTDQAPLAVSVPPSTRRILSEIGALRLVENAGFLRTTGNTSFWGAVGPRVETFGEEGHGWQVLRSDLEALLKRAARGAGVVLHAGRVKEIRRENPERLVVEDAALPGLRARIVIDASGRSGVAARRVRRAAGPRTLALSRVFRSATGFRVPDDTHTLVEAHAAGWAWSVPVARGERHVTLMLDPPPSSARPPDHGATYGLELARAPRLRALVDDAHAVGPTVALDATPYTAASFAPEGVLLAGDAASFLDPLSSYGVKKAFFSGWLAAVAAHTALLHPDRGELAFSFHADQEARLYARYAREAARYAGERAAAHPSSRFWATRAALPSVGDDEAPLAGPDAVQAAFERMRGCPGLRLRLHEGAAVVSAPAVRDREVVRSEALLGPDGRVAHFVDGVSATVVARLLDEHPRDVGTLCEAYHAAVPRTGLPDLLRALATLLAAGFLREEE
jgi:flavin-dependent dehydrogenase